VYVSGTYEPNTLCVLRALLRPGDVFFDVGAHAGLVTLAASRWVGSGGTIYSFEPSEREHRRLVESLELSSAANVTPVRAAVAATSGRGALRVAGDANSGLNTLGDRFAYDGVDTSRIEPVETIALDDFVHEHRIGRVAALKLDIEGGEAAALAGAERLLHDMRPTLILEVASRALEANGSTRLDVEALLHQSGYRICAIDYVTAALLPLASLAEVEGENVVGLARERSEML
jgi:FkbM family methyltransferase